MKITFWGVRGSITCPGPRTVKYGGNTPCIEVCLQDSRRLIIIDAGSGIRELGMDLMGRNAPGASMEIDIFLTHTHWDHIQGLPFFTPIYLPAARLRIHGPATFEERSLKEVLGATMSYQYFPVRQAELSAQITYIDIKEGAFDLGGGLSLRTKYLSHPVLCLAYRFEYGGKVLCTAYDTEPFRNLFCSDPENPDYDEGMHREGEQIAREANFQLEAFFQDADLLIYDAQYTQTEYESGKIGWGHSPCEYAIDAAARAGVKQLALFHHDPLRSDAQLDQLSMQLKCRHNTANPDVFFAREGESVEL